MSESQSKELTYSQFIYNRPSLTEVTKQYQELNDRFDQAQTSAQAIEVIKEWNEIRIDYRTNTSLIGTKFSQNVKDEWAKNEKDYLDEIGPAISEIKTNFIKKILASPFVEDI